MDLQEFNAEMLYFEGDGNPLVDELLEKAASDYGPASEVMLMRALALDGKNLVALIGLYRFYYYQGRYADGIKVAHRVMAVVGDKIGFPANWKDISLLSVKNGLVHSFCLVRLYFFALKAAGYLHLRMLNYEDGREMIEKVVAMDSSDRIGAKLLLDILDNKKADIVPFPRQPEAC
ncbi:hypothetical protein SAMN02745866_01849 [Alteromonadaceae bacterium Bs31]|nr:hypothetical protein SAMN02745866_01849 [Alteromonadaceae bacterium Bs31]